MSDGMAHLHSRLEKLAHGMQKVGHPCPKPSVLSQNQDRFHVVFLCFSVLLMICYSMCHHECRVRREDRKALAPLENF